MNLKSYLAEHNYTQQRFITEVRDYTGHKFPQGTLAKYVLGQRIPRKKEMIIIYEFTKGVVDPNSFYFD